MPDSNTTYAGIIVTTEGTMGEDFTSSGEAKKVDEMRVVGLRG